MSKTDELLLAFYGDDITGSTDALDGLARNSIPSVLFIDPPTPADLREFPDVRAVGIAGTSRAMTPDKMADELPSAFRALATLDPPIVHYKVCSTFDSSPELGSIGTAIDIGQSVFESPLIPVSQGTTSPHGRYVVFGNLFAEKDGHTYRLDRHPTMSTHPRTPMTESDLSRHLGKQTTRPIGLLDVHDLSSLDPMESSLRDAVDPEAEIVILDALSTDDLDSIGGLLWSEARELGRPLFCVGSSGLEHDTLPDRWKATGEIEPDDGVYETRSSVDRMLVMSGSAAPTTAAQIEHAEAAGFETIGLDSVDLIDPDERERERRSVVRDAVDHLRDGRSVIVYSAKGSDDPMIKSTRHWFNELDLPGKLGDHLGREQGVIVREILKSVDLKRACVAGGDTSGAVLSELGITALKPVAAVAPGAPLCRASADSAPSDDLEVAFKGGQTGTEEFFELVRSGGTTAD